MQEKLANMENTANSCVLSEEIKVSKRKNEIPELFLMNNKNNDKSDQNIDEIKGSCSNERTGMLRNKCKSSSEAANTDDGNIGTIAYFTETISNNGMKLEYKLRNSIMKQYNNRNGNYRSCNRSKYVLYTVFLDLFTLILGLLYQLAIVGNPAQLGPTASIKEGARPSNVIPAHAAGSNRSCQLCYSIALIVCILL